MIRSIYGIAFRFFKTNRFVSISSVISVTIAVCIILVMTMFVSNATQSYRDEIKKLYGNMDMMVGFNLEQGRQIDLKLLNQITSIPGIEQSSPVLIDRLRVDLLQDDVYTVGAESDDLVKSKYHFTETISGNEAILNAGLAEALNITVGQSLKVEGRDFIVKEILEDIKGWGSVTDILIIPRSTFKELKYAPTGVVNESTYILIKNQPRADSYEIARWLRQIDETLRIDIIEEEPEIKANFQSLRIYITLLSLLVVFITALLIISNFQTYLYKYKQQFAIMRSMGAMTHDLFKIIFIQCSIINLFGGTLGYTAAFIAIKYSQIWFEQLFNIPVEALIFNNSLALIVLVLSVAILELFMLIPAYRGSRILPLKMMQSNEQADFSFSNMRRIFGRIIIFAGLFFLLFGKVLASADSQVLLILLGLLFLILGVFILFPFYLSPLLIRLLPLIQRLFGKVSFVAVKNVIPQVRKNTFVILILSLTMMIAVVGSTLMSTIQRNEANYIRGNYPTDIVITSRFNDPSLINYTDLKSAAIKVEGVIGASTLSSYSSIRLMHDGSYVSFTYSLADLKEMIKQDLLPNYDSNSNDNVYITQKFASQYDIREGDILELGMYSDAMQKIIPTGQVTVAGIVKKLPGSLGDMLIDWSNETYLWEFTVLDRMFISVSQPVEQVIGQLEALKGQFPGIQIDYYEQTMEKSKQMFYQRWSLFIIVLVVMLVSVLMGIINTLVSNIHNKRKELAILRTLSVTRSGIIRVILTQVILYISIGLLLGAGIGVLLTYSLMLIDPVGIYINYQAMGILAVTVTGAVILVLWPYSIYIGRRSLPHEITQEG